MESHLELLKSKLYPPLQIQSLSSRESKSNISDLSVEECVQQFYTWAKQISAGMVFLASDGVGIINKSTFKLNFQILWRDSVI